MIGLRFIIPTALILENIVPLQWRHVIMSSMASQITGISIVYSPICSDTYQWLEQLERLRSENTLRCPMITHIHIRSKVKTRQSQSYKFKTLHYTRHTFWSYLIRCVNMKLIRLVLWKLQSGHESVHRRTDRRTDGRRETSIPPFNFVEAGV